MNHLREPSMGHEGSMPQLQWLSISPYPESNQSIDPYFFNINYNSIYD